jgi:hypothetical protein
LAGGIQTAVVYCVVVTLREQVHLAVLLLMHLEYTVHDWDVSVCNFEDDYVARSEWRKSHVEEENVTSMEGWFHATTQHDDHWTF